jgi:TM2 domain-containing membrane protein YozV
MVQKSKLVSLLLCWFLGWLGIHRFYTGKVWTGILYLCTGGIWGFGTFIDTLLMLFNAYKDKQGVPLKNDIPTILIIVLYMIWLVVLGAFLMASGLIDLVVSMFA